MEDWRGGKEEKYDNLKFSGDTGGFCECLMT